MCELPASEEFLRIKDVAKRVGLSQSEIYRRQSDTDPALNPFPKPHHYQRDPKKGAFYRLSDILAWMARELGLELDPAISKLLG